MDPADLSIPPFDRVSEFSFDEDDNLAPVRLVPLANDEDVDW